MTILDKHIHRPPQDRHRLVALDSTHLRCIDCQHTLDVSNLSNARQPVAGSTSPTPSPLGVNDGRACPRHVGQHADACGLCRAEKLEANRPLHLVKGSDPTSVSEWQKARERFGSKRKPGEAS